MEKWIERYEEAKRQHLKYCQHFRRSRGTKNQPYPSILEPLPKLPTRRWLDVAIQDAKLAGHNDTKEEEELALGCDWHVSVYGLSHMDKLFR